MRMQQGIACFATTTDNASVHPLYPLIHQKRVQVLHFARRFPSLTSCIPLALRMDWRHWWQDWLCPRLAACPRLTAFPVPTSLFFFPLPVTELPLMELWDIVRCLRIRFPGLGELLLQAICLLLLLRTRAGKSFVESFATESLSAMLADSRQKPADLF